MAEGVTNGVKGQATNVTGQATQPLNSTPLGTISGALQGGINNITNSGSQYLDRFFPPERRNEIKARLTKFATEKPKVASFLLSQIALSGPPIFLLVALTIGVGVFALLAGLIIGLVGALLFIVAMIGVALVIILPTLFVTTFAAAFIWLWGMGLYYIIKWFNEKPVPGIHTSLKDGIMEKSGLQGIQDSIMGGFNGDNKPPPADEQDASSRNGHVNGEKEDHEKENHDDRKPQKLPPKKTPEKKEGTNVAPKKRTESPANSKSPASTVKITGSDVAKAGGDLKKKTGPVGNAADGVTGAAGISL